MGSQRGLASNSKVLSVIFCLGGFVFFLLRVGCCFSEGGCFSFWGFSCMFVFFVCLVGVFLDKDESN